MDESRSYRRAIQRFAILTVCGCTFFRASAEGLAGEPTGVNAPSPHANRVSAQGQPSDSLQSLLREGWQARLHATESVRTALIPMTPDPAAKSLAELIRCEARVAPERKPLDDKVQAEVSVSTHGKGANLTSDAKVEKPQTLDSLPMLTFKELVSLSGEAQLHAPVTSRTVPEIEPLADCFSNVETKRNTYIDGAGRGDAVEQPAPSPDSEAVVTTESHRRERTESADSTLQLPEPFDDESKFARMRNVAKAQGFGMMALDCLEPPVGQSEPPAMNDSESVNASNKIVSVRTSTTEPSASRKRPKSALSQFKSWLPKFRRE